MINMKKITLILPLFVFLNTIVASCSKEAETISVNMFSEENNLEISRLSSDSSLYNAVSDRRFHLSILLGVNQQGAFLAVKIQSSTNGNRLSRCYQSS
jgi:hypothetical protein